MELFNVNIKELLGPALLTWIHFDPNRHIIGHVITYPCPVLSQSMPNKHGLRTVCSGLVSTDLTHILQGWVHCTGTILWLFSISANVNEEALVNMSTFDV